MYGLTGRSNGFRQNIGKSYEEIYGKEKGKEQRIKRSESGKKNVSNVLEVGKNTRFEKGHKNLCPAGGVGASKISVAQTKNKEQRSKHLRKLILENKFTPMWCSGKYKSGIREDLGHYVRSSWEANVCRILNYLNIKYEYESRRCRVDLGDSIYICDLYLPEYDLFVEIKPTNFIKGHLKANKFHLLYPNIHFDFIHTDLYKDLGKQFIDVIPNWEK